MVLGFAAARGADVDADDRGVDVVLQDEPRWIRAVISARKLRLSAVVVSLSAPDPRRPEALDRCKRATLEALEAARRAAEPPRKKKKKKRERAEGAPAAPFLDALAVVDVAAEPDRGERAALAARADALGGFDENRDELSVAGRSTLLARIYDRHAAAAPRATRKAAKGDRAARKGLRALRRLGLVGGPERQSPTRARSVRASRRVVLQERRPSRGRRRTPRE